MARVLAPLSERLGIAFEFGHVISDPEELELLAKNLDLPDPQRFFLHLSIEDAGGTSDLTVYAPGVVRGTDPAASTRPTALPGHLEEVPLDVAALLGSVDVPLSELLAIEIGDVISLGARADAPVEVRIEDRPCALATWGRVDDHLALRIEKIDVHARESDS
jgi:flagellar motor switch/type III secretory pathway protein FliN